MATCEACGTECPPGAAFCSACGHRLGSRPGEPPVVNVRVVNSAWDSCWSCFGTALGVLILIGLAAWLFSC
ncbi:MAG: zinc ribbon domain-containing protein [Thermoleophilia bacterium]|nr:zinc ribbon domain-containing protein [Thermoleophilia bacterium]